MAFSLRNLSVLAYANGFTLWHYKGGDDTIGDVTAEDYFDDGRELLAQGDALMISATDGARMVCVAESGEAPVKLAQLV